LRVEQLAFGPAFFSGVLAAADLKHQEHQAHETTAEVAREERDAPNEPLRMVGARFRARGGRRRGVTRDSLVACAASCRRCCARVAIDCTRSLREAVAQGLPRIVEKRSPRAIGHRSRDRSHGAARVAPRIDPKFACAGSLCA
jgi:hypothetical protein